MLRRNASLRVILILVASLAAMAVPASAVKYPDRGKAGLRPRLVAMLHGVERHFGRKILVVSGCRSRAQNRRIGGARESYHLRCMAADIFVPGVAKSRVLHHLRAIPGRGGVGTYCRTGFLHLDVGPRRDWAWGCGRKKFKRKARRRR
jgi:uncharacterized protein YcbK (DUF882 family)